MSDYRIDPFALTELDTFKVLDASTIAEAAENDPGKALIMGVNTDSIAIATAVVHNEKLKEAICSSFGSHKEIFLSLDKLGIDLNSKLNIITIANKILETFDFKNVEEACDVMYELGAFFYLFMKDGGKVPDLH